MIDMQVILKLLKNNKKFCVALILFFIAFVPTMIWMWDRWWAADSYYSHGILVPFVTGYLIWQKREELSKIAVKESPWGMVLIIFGMSIHLISALFRIYFTSGFAMFIVFLGMVLFFFGNKIFQKIAFPLAFLAFMIPLPMFMIVNISFKMKILAAHIATWMLNNMRIPAIREGSLIRMQTSYVVVDDVCSGLRSLISLTALGSIFAYMMTGKVWKKVVLFLSTIPIAIFTNVVRVLILSSVSEIFGPKYAEGFIHDASGFSVFALAFILLYAVGKLLD